jgi:hypothetical protein
MPELHERQSNSGRSDSGIAEYKGEGNLEENGSRICTGSGDQKTQWDYVCTVTKTLKIFYYYLIEMTSTFTNVFSQEDLVYLQQLPEVLRAKNDLLNTNVVYFTVQITDSIREAMQHVGLDLSNVQSVPMRWIKGDTAPHVDVGATAFDKTFLVYLNNNAGSLIIDRAEYPIRENAGYVFNEGLNHKTIHTGLEPRLLLGPMNERGCTVGAQYVYYYNSEMDASGQINVITTSDSYTVQNVNGITSWIIASNSTGTTTGTVTAGTILNSDVPNSRYNLYPLSGPGPVPCFLAGTRILTPMGYKRIEEIESGEQILTSDRRAVKANVYSFSTETTTENAPYCIPAGTLGNHSPSRDLHLTGNHAIKDSNGVWQIPKYLAQKNPEIQQHSVGTIVTYYHLECPNYMKDNLIAEGVTAESLNTKGKVIWKRTNAGYVRMNPAKNPKNSILNPLLRSLRTPSS